MFPRFPVSAFPILGGYSAEGVTQAMMRMKLGNLLLAIWLLLTGLTTVTNISFSSRDVVMGVIALLAGVFLILGR